MSPPLGNRKPKARLLKGLVRHASAPVRPQLRLERHNSSEGQQTISKRPCASPRSKPNLLSELSLAQPVIARLRLDRDEWRNTAQTQERQLLSNANNLETQEHTIADLEHQNAALRTGYDNEVSANNKLLARLRDVVGKHDKLVDQANDSVRTAARLKKSDRAKGKVWQKNLRLKATLQRYTMQDTWVPAASDTNTEASLMEALALASERIEELESKGEVLLEALEIYKDGEDTPKEDHDMANLTEAEGSFRGVLEDETFKEQKDAWGDLLGE